MRNLQSSDLFAACRLLSAIGIRDEIKSVAEKANTLKDITQFDLGYDLMYNLFEKATTSQSEKEFYKFFSNILECKPDEIAKMDPCEFLDKILEIADVQKWRDFFSKVLSLMKKR